MRDFKKLKTLNDYKILDSLEKVIDVKNPIIPDKKEVMILRMLVRPKYGNFIIPDELKFLEEIIYSLSEYDVKRTGIEHSWCYVTIRHGEVKSKTDDEWHFDGSSFRTDIIPERNYIWVNHSPTEYKEGNLDIPNDFDPIKHDLFSFASCQLEKNPIKTAKEKTWWLLSPFCLHKRPFIDNSKSRTFYRICFTDIEGRDINNTQNPLLYTEFYNRNPVKTFRDNLQNYYNN